MSNELVKTALTDWLSVKPLQSAPVPSRLRSGCRMMCPTGCLPAHCVMCRSRLACLPLPNSLLIRLAYPSRTSPRLSCRASLRPACLALRLVASFRRAYPSGMSVSYRPSSRSAYSPRSSCRRAGRPSSHCHLIMRSAYRPCVLACRHASRSSSWCGCGCHRPVPAFRRYRAASASSRLLAPLIRVGRRGDVVRLGRLGCYFFSRGISMRSCAFLGVLML